MSYQTLLRLMADLLVVALLGVACGGQQSSPTVATTPIPPTATLMAPMPTSTPVPPTLTATPVPPTATPTPTPVLPTQTPVPPTATPTTIPTATPTPPACIVQDGEWVSGTGISFRVSNCKVSDYSQAFLVPGPAPGTVIGLVFVRFVGPFPIKDNKFSFQQAQGEGTLSVSGTFTSATKARGIWTLTKGAEVGALRAEEDTSDEWSASPK